MEESDALLLPHLAKKASDRDVSKCSLEIASRPAAPCPLTYAAGDVVASSSAVISHRIFHYLFVIKQSPELCRWFSAAEKTKHVESVFIFSENIAVLHTISMACAGWHMESDCANR